MSIENMKKLRVLGWSLLASCAVALCSCQMCEWTRDFGCDGDCFSHAQVCTKPTVRALAHDLDALEAHIEKYGSVVIQHPTVWGQARLTRHREEFEKVMKNDLCCFKQTLQGSLARTDQAYFANAMALSNAAGGGGAGTTATSSATSTTDLSTLTNVPDGAIKRNDAKLPEALKFAAQDQGITTEPSVYLSQKARYLNHLHELRRINEGDDTADSPGYSLNLVRVPVSVLPGKCTQHGCGAEVTMTLKPYLSDELLPMTFRNLVVNDLLEFLGVPMTQFLNDPDQLAYFKALQQVFENESAQAKKKPLYELKYNELSPSSKKILGQSPRSVQARLEDLKRRDAKLALANAMSGSAFVVPATKVRHSRRPFPPSQTVDIFGHAETDVVLNAAIHLFKSDPANKYWTHYPDVEGYLQEELNGAYRFLSEPANGHLWDHCNLALVQAIHARKLDTIAQMRWNFAAAAKKVSNREMDKDVTVALAWTIIVESALLTNQLVQDTKEAAAARNCPCPTTDWLPYYLPVPPPEARAAFNRYVECRWPIIVFALDPVNEQQNIADSFSARREMQLAMSLAFVGGQISARNLMRFTRRLELDAETIALNSTTIGFSHGNETFGWRFYPRFQTPDTEGNLKVFVRDQLIGGPSRNALLRQRKLEPGQRECIAIVIMPSFVPYASLEVSSNWFSLVNPKHKDMTCVDAVKMSARVKAIDNCAPNVMDADCYRDGELERLRARAKQLEARLPLQSMKVQVPYENTLGGFAMFNTGITDLAPELYGWYGAPGIDLNDATTLFLIGNHFSPHQTKVIVGGINITDTELLSRQVMRVTIPKGALAIDRLTGMFPDCPPNDGTCRPAPTPANPQPDAGKGKKAARMVAFGDPHTDAGAGSTGKKTTADGNTAPAKPDAPRWPLTPTPCQELLVNVHIATPYGVTSHLLVPTCPTRVERGTSSPNDGNPCAPGCSDAAAPSSTTKKTASAAEQTQTPTATPSATPAATAKPKAAVPKPLPKGTPKGTIGAKTAHVRQAREARFDAPVGADTPPPQALAQRAAPVP